MSLWFTHLCYTVTIKLQRQLPVFLRVFGRIDWDCAISMSALLWLYVSCCTCFSRRCRQVKCWSDNGKCCALQVRYTGFRDRPPDERQLRFQTECREGHADIVSTH